MWCSSRNTFEKSGVRFNWKSYTAFGPVILRALWCRSLARFNATGSANAARAFDGQIPTNYKSTRRDFPAIMPADGRQIVSECFQTSSGLYYWPPVDLSKSSLRPERQRYCGWMKWRKCGIIAITAAGAEAITWRLSWTGGFAAKGDFNILNQDYEINVNFDKKLY